MYLIQILSLIGLNTEEIFSPAMPLMYHVRMSRCFGGPNAALLLLALAECLREEFHRALIQREISFDEGKESLVKKWSVLRAPATDATIEYYTGLTKSKQRGAMKKLKALGLICEEMRGVPSRRYVWIDFVRVMELLK